jgi:tight adherence protein B
MTIRLNKDNDNQIALSRKSKPRLSDRIGERFKSYHLGEGLEQLILHSASSTSVEQVLLVGFTIAIAAGITVHWLLESWLAALPAVVAGAFVPYGWLLFQRSRRLGKFNACLPDAIDLMARALRAGHSMASSIEVIAEQSPEPLASEFATCFQQQKFGIPYRDALLAMGERVPSDDLQFFITAVLVQKETGGDLTDILDRTTAVIRDRIRIQGEVATRTAQGRMTGWILSALPIVLLVVINIITPGYTHVLFTDPLGQKLLIAGGVLILIGGFIISRIVDIRV